jgi:hypothetical protein
MESPRIHLVLLKSGVFVLKKGIFRAFPPCFALLSRFPHLKTLITAGGLCLLLAPSFHPPIPPCTGGAPAGDLISLGEVPQAG